ERLHYWAPFGAPPATWTASRNLKEPDAATCSPALSPSRITISSPSIGPLRTGRMCARILPLESGVTTKTWSPDGPRRSALTGITMALTLGPLGTSTRTDEPGAGALGPPIVARTVVVRVVGSTRASTATIRPAIGVESAV